MAVNRVPVLKRCRSLGLEPTYLGIDKKSTRELKRSSRKVSEYGLQLREKQKAKFIYGVLEKPFRNYYEKADRMPGMTGENLMQLLELRLDNVIFRLGFARTRREARQIVDHKFVLVNGKRVNIPSYEVKAGDKIEIKESKKSSPRFKAENGILAATSGRAVPEWLEADAEKLEGTVKEVPARAAIDVPVDEMQIIELYSK
ncbi:MAG: 30S ribosomal protein S4 [Eubacteriales bacterium]|jgi:small subunit ribosomal protein S4|nr:30S ribosomal protein S4 [Lachnospiraceae bacterium]MDD5860090.1 30S ribosomal protein S4 [Eubacteriales bacterium]MCH4063146.1 30S ribosomal protein S4 [Lachnospiraceae bacterium]MCH4104969.1 30S ribosomal protein S4 [Lachnospiraceae bacterium]MCI1308427.1 30S ribosomal protein S4 [Lachnospiraceae bacterium]